MRKKLGPFTGEKDWASVTGEKPLTGSLPPLTGEKKLVPLTGEKNTGPLIVEKRPGLPFTCE